MKKGLKKVMTIILLIVLVFVMGVLIFMFVPGGNRKVPGGNKKGMYVDGTVLKKSDGTPFVMRGINHAHCWYAEEDEKAFNAIAETGANSIRIVLANGIRWDSDTKESVAKVIEDARSRDMVAIIEVHDGTGDDSIENLKKIADFWIEMADVIKGTEDYCIVNIANEWCGSWNTKLWCEGYTEVIPRIREAGIENVIMVDAAGWGQYAKSIREKGVDVFEADPLKNTMFSVHMYGMSGRYEWLIRYNLNGATKHNLCVCVGEFGYTHSDGDVKEDYLMKYCEEKGIGTLAWSWKGNSGGVEYLDLSSDWEGKSLTPEWGEKVVNGEFGIRKTSK